ncbi:MAG: isopentenyl-diphosphate Delta-isomerase [Synergistaceae bacterium]|jgi:isopentenyl-diphosphate delta-isomerase|nr:isopentenyl-diphosphate Delta-isomerase [Synergistaceae bacterium]
MGMTDQIVLVDIYDRERGGMDKDAAHREPHLHRAFSIFLFDGDRILLQLRAAHKYHSGNLWTNSCCSHPRVGEDLRSAAPRRLQEELGVLAELREIASFVYYHQFADDLYEYEFDHVLIGEYNGPLNPNPEEVAEVLWVTRDSLALDLLERPKAYSAWFRTAAPIVLGHLGSHSV